MLLSIGDIRQCLYFVYVVILTIFQTNEQNHIEYTYQFKYKLNK